MKTFRLCWSILVVCYMWWGTTPHLVCAQTYDAKFELEKGIRYQCGVIGRRSVRSRLQCAAECATEKSCYGFNFGSGLCELLSVAASGRANAPGWIHGYYRGGEYDRNHQL